MASSEPHKITLEIDQDILLRLKVYAVSNGYTFSNVVASAVLAILDQPDRPAHFSSFKDKYRHIDFSDLVSPGRGRPSAAYLAEHGPILRKKATFWLQSATIRKIGQYAVNNLRLDRSSFVNIALKIHLDSK